MLKLKARRRIATKAAAAGVVSAGILFGVLPLFGATADTKTITYNCTTSGGDPQNPDLITTLTATATAGTTATSIQRIAMVWTNLNTVTGKMMTAPVTINTTDTVIFEGEIVMTGPQTGVTATVTALATLTPAAQVAQGAAIPLPTVSVTATPAATGTVSVKTTGFLLTIGASTSAREYDCAMASTATAAAATVVVASGAASPSPTPTPTPSPTPSATTPTPRQTRTFTATVTASQPGQVTNTPGGGVSTGGGGELGPDGRLLVLGGTALILAAITGGLMLRSRRGAVRQ
ncbi:hypothetical protein Aph01nite_37890 [Acrocarpospora phusangensis]|uniref:Uncharacterized protein n=1 Tax=Acrocarpospora phusangensis TaxID=1070424 RepID=A0A919QD18_9ACTN|nr:hypothetical protein [Acrocarpospora phusangensis]GIH25479.1 hypothetical protein Aph01nite_37890 [Acrocarpospora phusangensis]